MTAKELIDWSNLSRILSKGGRGSIRMNRVPAKYKKKVNRLIKIIDLWMKWI